MSLRRMDNNGPRGGNSGSNGSQYRVNEMIRAPQVRVISEEDDQLGIMSSQEALAKARAAGLDLVEVAAQATPPVCRIMDYGKYKYQKKKRVAKQQANKTQIKELRLRPKTGAADVQVKINKAKEFLAKNDKVMVVIVFRGRESIYVDEGRKLLDAFIAELEEVAKVEAVPKLLNKKRLYCTLAPKAESSKQTAKRA